ncbi:hypothetical protein GCK72_008446 [Caenorhabditis remanei]|uniref:Uncharacterized protein n=1 Tax=Caenorhabditis remanei TaxID=31234 RepID=A0A6A5GXM0_CAERE|nr:hypothetical protein GCK72_008446 [Caenorhabditis remanei]KAF1760200.1 hypothetical protein GCK72_008446 [Caenorhabditis remanei]
MLLVAQRATMANRERRRRRAPTGHQKRGISKDSKCHWKSEVCVQIDKRKSGLIDKEKKSSVDSVETKSLFDSTTSEFISTKIGHQEKPREEKVKKVTLDSPV